MALFIDIMLACLPWLRMVSFASLTNFLFLVVVVMHLVELLTCLAANVMVYGVKGTCFACESPCSQELWDMRCVFQQHSQQHGNLSFPALSISVS